MLWVLKRTDSMRWFFLSTQNICNYNFTLKILLNWPCAALYVVSSRMAQPIIIQSVLKIAFQSKQLSDRDHILIHRNYGMAVDFNSHAKPRQTITKPAASPYPGLRTVKR